jgi:hypothetical protein
LASGVVLYQYNFSPADAPKPPACDKLFEAKKGDAMKRLIVSILLLTGLAAPAFGVEQLTEAAPLLSYPSLSFTRDSGWHVHEVELPWARNLRPAEYVIGTTITEGMAGSEALVIAARRNASSEGRAGAMRTIPVEDGWRGKMVRLSARMKSSGVYRAQLWLYAARPTPVRRWQASYRHSSLRDGANDWCRMAFELRIPEDATSLSYGLSLSGGEGAVWADSFTVQMVERSMPRRMDSCRPARQLGDGLLWGASSLNPAPELTNADTVGVR